MLKTTHQDIQALRRMISQADLSLGTNPDPNHPSIKRAKELLSSAGKLAEYLAKINPAASLGSRGGTKTAERGPDHFRQLAAMRKTRAGGRPRKDDPEQPSTAKRA